VPGRIGMGCGRGRSGNAGPEGCAGMLTRSRRDPTADLDAELLAGFVDRLYTLDLDEPPSRRQGPRGPPERPGRGR
jgi:hypothetical protein